MMLCSWCCVDGVVLMVSELMFCVHGVVGVVLVASEMMMKMMMMIVMMMMMMMMVMMCW